MTMKVFLTALLLIGLLWGQGATSAAGADPDHHRSVQATPVHQQGAYHQDHRYRDRDDRYVKLHRRGHPRVWYHGHRGFWINTWPEAGGIRTFVYEDQLGHCYIWDGRYMRVWCDPWVIGVCYCS